MRRTLVVGDVHGCAEELSALLKLARADRVVFVGDLFTKGPDPVGVWCLVRAHEAVLGNHDDRLLKIVAGKRRNDVHGREVIDALNREAAGWLGWLQGCPLTLRIDDWVIVHAALDASGDPDKTSRRTALVERARGGADPASRWWQSYRGRARVVFGHDAVRGLVRVESGGVPSIIGLDSGCVYGGYLAGYLLEQDRMYAVRAKQTYCAVG